MTSTPASGEAWDMTPAQRMERAVVISGADMPGQEELLVHSCEDCACPVTDDLRRQVTRSASAPAAGSPLQWTSGREIVEIPLVPDHRLLFNPVGHGGAV